MRESGCLRLRSGLTIRVFRRAWGGVGCDFSVEKCESEVGEVFNKQSPPSTRTSRNTQFVHFETI